MERTTYKERVRKKTQQRSMESLIGVKKRERKRKKTVGRHRTAAKYLDKLSKQKVSSLRPAAPRGLLDPYDLNND